MFFCQVNLLFSCHPLILHVSSSRLFLDNAELPEVISFFETYYSHIFYIVYDAFITAEVSLRQKGAHKAQREELEAVLYLFEKVSVHNSVF